jgi:hypothetical protein
MRCAGAGPPPPRVRLHLRVEAPAATPEPPVATFLIEVHWSLHPIRPTPRALPEPWGGDPWADPLVDQLPALPFWFESEEAP